MSITNPVDLSKQVATQDLYLPLITDSPNLTTRTDYYNANKVQPWCFQSSV